MNSFQKNKKTRIRFSQHFLTDANVLNKISESVGSLYKDKVLEAGPGRGALTEIMLGKRPKSLTLVEKDPSLILDLKEKYPSCNIINQDILDYKVKENVFASSVPYSITREILLLICRSRSVRLSYLIIQKEVAQKISFENPVPISVFVRTFFEVEKIFDIKKNSFTPPPKITSSFVVLKRIKDYKENDYADYWNFLTKTMSRKNKSAEFLDEKFKGRRVSGLKGEELLKTYVDKDIHTH